MNTPRTSVRWLFDRLEQYEPCLVIEGDKLAACVVLETPVRIFSIDKADVPTMRIVERTTYAKKVATTVAYDVTESAKQMVRWGRDSRGITKLARLLCDTVAAGLPITDAMIRAIDKPQNVLPVNLEREALIRKQARAAAKPVVVETPVEPEVVIDLTPVAAAPAPKRGSLDLTPALRRKLRAAGFRAPYSAANLAALGAAA